MQISDQTKEELDIMAKKNVDQIASDVYALCETTNELIQEKLDFAMKIANSSLSRYGGVSKGRDYVSWRAVNQLNHSVMRIDLPKFYAGGTWLGQESSFSQNVPIVDEVAKVSGSKCTIFQRINDRGDMLRVATNVEDARGQRAIGTYIPAINPDGEPNPVISAIFNGQVYSGAAFVVDDWYVTKYKQLIDKNNRIVGMIFVGEKISEVQPLKEAIRNIKIGERGYVYVLSAKGQHKGSYVVARKPEDEGRSVWNHQDESTGRYVAREIIQKARLLAEGQKFYEEYTLQNPDDDKPYKKMASVAYFKPWNWVIGASSYKEDFYTAHEKVNDKINEFKISLIFVGILVVSLAILAAIYFSRRLTNPIYVVNSIAKKVAEGNLAEARNHIHSFLTNKNDDDKNPKKLKFFNKKDELYDLMKSISSMTDNLKLLIGQVHRSGIQVTTSATEISASSRELESAVAEQTAASRQVTESSHLIARRSKELGSSIEKVGESVNKTASTAESGRTNIIRLEKAMQGLMGATVSISKKLGIINDKANNITAIVTTINKISDQTNLLSLNAAIEAEKAGEYGKGFSVVAREITRLADQTANATSDIERMVGEMQGSVTKGVMEMDRFIKDVKSESDEVSDVGNKFNNVIDQVRGLIPEFDIVEEGISEQSESANEISQAMGQLTEVAAQTRESLEEFKYATEQLNEAVSGLQSEVGRFNVDDK